MTMHMLDQTAPGLAKELQTLSLDQQRRLVVKACMLASGALSDLQPEVRALLMRAAAQNILSAPEVGQLRKLADDADNRYFSLQEAGAAPSIWMDWFGQARLLTAMWNAFRQTPCSDPALAIYELCSTRDDPAPIIDLVRAELT